jgi:hypothetical protein
MAEFWNPTGRRNQFTPRRGAPRGAGRHPPAGGRLPRLLRPGRPHPGGTGLPRIRGGVERGGGRVSAPAEHPAAHPELRAGRLAGRAARLDRREIPRVERLRRRPVVSLQRRFHPDPGVALLVHPDHLDLLQAVLRVRQGADEARGARGGSHRRGRVPGRSHPAAPQLGRTHLQRHQVHPMPRGGHFAAHKNPSCFATTSSAFSAHTGEDLRRSERSRPRPAANRSRPPR